MPKAYGYDSKKVIKGNAKAKWVDGKVRKPKSKSKNR